MRPRKSVLLCCAGVLLIAMTSLSYLPGGRPAVLSDESLANDGLDDSVKPPLEEPVQREEALAETLPGVYVQEKVTPAVADVLREGMPTWFLQLFVYPSPQQHVPNPSIAAIQRNQENSNPRKTVGRSRSSGDRDETRVGDDDDDDERSHRRRDDDRDDSWSSRGRDDDDKRGRRHRDDRNGDDLKSPKMTLRQWHDEDDEDDNNKDDETMRSAVDDGANGSVPVSDNEDEGVTAKLLTTANARKTTSSAPRTGQGSQSAKTSATGGKSASPSSSSQSSSAKSQSGQVSQPAKSTSTGGKSANPSGVKPTSSTGGKSQANSGGKGAGQSGTGKGQSSALGTGSGATSAPGVASGAAAGSSTMSGAPGDVGAGAGAPQGASPITGAPGDATAAGGAGQPAAAATQPNMTANACIQWLCGLTPPIVDEGASYLSWQRANPTSDEQVVSCVATLRQAKKRVWDNTPSCRYGKGQERYTKPALPSGAT